jgi:hypothetical protein
MAGQERFAMGKSRISKSPAQWAKLITARWTQTVRAILETGRALIQAKRALGHGKFMAMVETLPFGQRTAQKLMAIAEHPVLSNASNWTHFPASWTTLYTLSTVPNKTLLAKLADGSLNPGIEGYEAEQWVSLTVHRKSTTKSESVTVEITKPPPQAPVVYTLIPADKEPEAEPYLDTSQPTGEIPRELREIEHQDRETETSGYDRYELLLAAWEAASTEDRMRFLDHIGARLLS